ncbi:hypothetical protein GCM10028774_62360 [Spirosoma jeollabukense]
MDSITGLIEKTSVMNSKPATLLLFCLLVGCNGSGVEPGEVAATTKGYLYIDNWGKSCGSGGLVTVINADTYLATNSVPVAYEGNSSEPVPVWIRYEKLSPDSCAQLTNRIKILSIRKRD